MDKWLDNYTDYEIIKELKLNPNKIKQTSDIEYIFIYYDYDFCLGLNCIDNIYVLFHLEEDYELSINLNRIDSEMDLNITDLNIPLEFFNGNELKKLIFKEMDLD